MCHSIFLCPLTPFRVGAVNSQLQKYQEMCALLYFHRITAELSLLDMFIHNSVLLAVYCMITSGSMLNRRSSLSLLTSSSRAVSSCRASCRSAVVIRGRPFSFTMMSPSLMPPLEKVGGTERSIKKTSTYYYTIVYITMYVLYY